MIINNKKMNNLNNKKVLIIGGTGLIGHEIVKQLNKSRVDIYSLSRGISKYSGDQQVKGLLGDRKDYKRLYEVISQYGPWECIIDMVCFKKDDANALIKASKGSVKQIILCSTTSVYEKPSDVYPIKTNFSLNSNSKYGQSKVECEQAFQNKFVNQGCFLTIIRPGQMFSQSSSILHSLGSSSSFLDRIIKGKKIIVHDNGLSLWSSLHVFDVANIFVSSIGNKAAYNKIYHATGNEYYSWLHYYHEIANSLKVVIPKIVQVPSAKLFKISPDRGKQAFESLQYHGIYDMNPTINDLNYKQSISLSDSIFETVSSIKQNKEIISYESDVEYDHILESVSK
ncbi:MAG: hypothetical protein COA79_17625 [Planctomycetota bacterium]|nr:MAG: hypothetical protein COA79_17625 [Planctomycetota bacterium]